MADRTSSENVLKMGTWKFFVLQIGCQNLKINNGGSNMVEFKCKNRLRYLKMTTRGFFASLVSNPKSKFNN